MKLSGMILGPLVLLAAVAQDGSSLPSPGEVPVYAVITADTLEVGGEYEIEVFVDLPQGAKASESGAPAPFLQIDVPPSVELLGQRLETYQELSANEFLQEPYERLLKENPARIPFRLVSEPAAGETIGLNVLAYVKPGGEVRDFFLRRRLELPLEGSVEAREGSAETSDWGVDEELLQIGDRAADFELPRADGTTLSLGDLIGEKNVVVTTYRAFW